MHCWGADRPGGGVPAVGYRPWEALDGQAPHRAALQAVSIDLAMAAGVEGAEVVHSHTWYTNFAGHLAKLLYGVPHVATVHSLEPLRPWKAEQLGGGYALSSFCERTGLEAADAIIAVSEGMRTGRARVLSGDRGRASRGDLQRRRHRGVPAGRGHRRTRAVRDRSGAAFGGVRRTHHAPEGAWVPARRRAGFDPQAQLVLCAGAPDTPELGAEVERTCRAPPRRARRRDLARPDAAEDRRSSRSSVTRPCSSARRSTSRSGSSTSRRWPARLRSSRPRREASSRSWRTALRACSSRSSHARRVAGAARSRGLRRRHRDSRQRVAARPGSRAGDGSRRTGAGDRALRLARDRRADAALYHATSRRP